jgi:hypothetical protein
MPSSSLYAAVAGLSSPGLGRGSGLRAQEWMDELLIQDDACVESGMCVVELSRFSECWTMETAYGCCSLLIKLNGLLHLLLITGRSSPPPPTSIPPSYRVTPSSLQWQTIIFIHLGSNAVAVRPTPLPSRPYSSWTIPIVEHHAIPGRDPSKTGQQQSSKHASLLDM